MKTQSSPYPYTQDDEIDLFELAEKLWARKWLIIGSTLLTTIISVAVALLRPATWQSETRVYMPSSADIGSYNSIQNQLAFSEEALSSKKSHSQKLFPQLTPEDSFNIFYRNLISQSTLRQVFFASGLAAQVPMDGKDREKTLSFAFNSFQNKLSINHSNENNPAIRSISISYDATTPEFAASLINDHLLPLTEQKTRQDFVANITSELQGEIAKIDKAIVLAENQFIEHSRLKTLRLEDALKIAAAGGITKPVNLNSGLLDDSDNSQFLLGTDILSTQLNIQKNDVNGYRLISNPMPGSADKPLLPKVATLFVAKQSLKILDTNLKNLKPVIIDEPAQVPVTPIKPKKRLIVALGAVLGGMLSVLIALIQIAITNRKERLRATAATLERAALHSEKLTIE